LPSNTFNGDESGQIDFLIHTADGQMKTVVNGAKYMDKWNKGIQINFADSRIRKVNLYTSASNNACLCL
jgi:hypothetical protein